MHLIEKNLLNWNAHRHSLCILERADEAFWVAEEIQVNDVK